MSIFAATILFFVLPALLGVVIKIWIEFEPTKHYVESDIEKQLNTSLSDERFESTWNMVAAEEAQSREKPRWNTPEEMLREEQLKRQHSVWTPRIPGVLHHPESKRK